MTRTKGKPGRRQADRAGAKTGIYALSIQNYTPHRANCQVFNLIGQAAFLAWKAWLSGEFRKAARHNAVFVALLDLANGGSS